MLITEPHFDAPDDFYEALIDAHHELNDAQSQALNARLVLLLANHIGNQATLVQALAAARAGAVERPQADDYVVRPEGVESSGSATLTREGKT